MAELSPSRTSASKEAEKLFFQKPNNYLLRVAIIALLYFASAKLALMLALPPTNASPVWLPAGIALTAVLIFGWQVWPGILIGYLLGNLDFNAGMPSVDDLTIKLSIGIGAVLQALLARALIKRFIGTPATITLDNGRDTFLFFILAGPAACTLSASIAHAVLLNQNILTLQEAELSWITWWIGDAIGVVLLTPMMMIVLGTRGSIWSKRRLTIALPLLAVASIAVMTFFFSNERDISRIQSELNEQIGDTHHELQKGFDETHLLLESIANYVKSSDEINANGFDTFATPYTQQYDWIKRIAWVPQIVKGSVTEVVNNKPKQRIVYAYPVKHSVPKSPHSTGSDEDLLQHPAIANAIEYAELSAMIATSKAIVYRKDDNPTLALLMPVFHSNETQLRGLILVEVEPAILINETLVDLLNSPLAVSVSYDEGLKIVSFYDNHKEKAGDNYPIQGHQVALYLGSQTIELEVSPAQHYLAGNRHSLAWLVLLTLLAFAAMMSGFLLVLTGRNSRITELVEKRTHALSAANDMLKQEVAKKREAQAKLESIAHFDPLTGLANRTMFKNSLNRTLARAHRNNTSFAVLYMDLDRFKSVNDTFGHKGGDSLLQEVGQRLIHCVREEDVVARLGGDEFVIIADDLTNKPDIAKLAQKVIDCLSKTIVINGRPYNTSTSIGIAICPDNGEDEETLLMHADTAMYRAKQAGTGNFRFYTSNMQVEAREKLRFEDDLKQALKNNEFTLNYQPICRFADGAIDSVEVLLRWTHPIKGPVSPEVFIPVAEELGLICEIGAWVFDQACQTAKVLKEHGIHVAVNVSTRQLDEADFIDYVFQTMDKHSISPTAIDLELTESVMMKDPDKISEQLQPLRDNGVNISVDDFGTGYSSLSYLKGLPIDTLKIDRSFVFDITQDTNSHAIIRAILALAHELDLMVVAEGLENEVQAGILKDLGCDLAQGYLLARPMTFEALMKHVEDKFLPPIAQIN